MKKADLKPGQVVAVRSYGDFARKAVVVAADGYVNTGYSWKEVIRPTTNPTQKTPKGYPTDNQPHSKDAESGNSSRTFLLLGGGCEGNIMGPGVSGTATDHVLLGGV